MRKIAEKAPARTEIVTGTTTASHLGAAGAADEAVAGTETEDAGVAILTTGHPRYESLLFPFCLHSFPVYTTKTKGSLSLVFSQCLTPIFVSLYLCVLLLTIKHDFQ